MKQLVVLTCLISFLAICTSAFKLQEKRDSVDTVIEKESKRAGLDATQFAELVEVITQGEGNNAEPSARFDEEIDQYFVDKLVDSVKKLAEDLKKALDNVGNHVVLPL
nr:uncharacterized protein LOC126540082 [Dermacentor andersoni]